MRIMFERSGGFTGIPMSATLDSDSSSPQDEQELRHMIETAGFFQLPSVIDSAGPGGDRFLYRLTIEIEGHQHAVEMSEAAVPPELRPLLERMMAAARRAPRNPR